ncbi:MAG: hypothetical protein WAL37_18265 [Xanthobacteraceae bacterium]
MAGLDPAMDVFVDIFPGAYAHYHALMLRGTDNCAANGVSGGAAESRNGSCATRLPTVRIYSRSIA